MKTKTTAVPIKDQFRDDPEIKVSSSVASGSALSQQLYTLIAQQPFFKGLSVHHLQVLLGYELMKRIAEVVIKDLHATQQRLMECDLKKWTG